MLFKIRLLLVTTVNAGKYLQLRLDNKRQQTHSLLMYMSIPTSFEAFLKNFVALLMGEKAVNSSIYGNQAELENTVWSATHYLPECLEYWIRITGTYRRERAGWSWKGSGGKMGHSLLFSKHPAGFADTLGVVRPCATRSVIIKLDDDEIRFLPKKSSYTDEARFSSKIFMYAGVVQLRLGNSLKQNGTI